MNVDGAAAQPGITRHDLLIGGRWQGAAAGQRHRVASPATGIDIADLAAAESADVDRAVAAGQGAFDKHASVTYFERARWCDDALLAATRSSRLGLSSAIFTRDIPRALRLAERLNVGQVVINDTSNYWELHMPFGGWPGTDSGIGRLGGRHALEALTEIRSVSIDVSG